MNSPPIFGFQSFSGWIGMFTGGYDLGFDPWPNKLKTGVDLGFEAFFNSLPSDSKSG